MKKRYQIDQERQRCYQASSDATGPLTENPSRADDAFP